MSESYLRLKTRRDELLSQVNLAREALAAEDGGDPSDIKDLESKLAVAQGEMHALVQLERNELYRMVELLDGLQRDLSDDSDEPTDEQIRLHAELQASARLAVESQRENPEVARLAEMLLERCAAVGGLLTRRG